MTLLVIPAKAGIHHRCHSERSEESTKNDVRQTRDSSAVEATVLRSQIATSKSGRGGARYLPHAFTEHGIAMLSTVLNSEQAIQVNIAIMRAFVRLRRVLSANVGLAKRLEAIEKRLFEHGDELNQHKGQNKEVFDAIRNLMADPVKPVPKIGFK